MGIGIALTAILEILSAQEIFRIYTCSPGVLANQPFIEREGRQKHADWVIGAETS